jgi:malonyl-CoA O-methyltransferase
MSIDNTHPLMQAVQDEILARLDLVTLKPKRILALGCDRLQERYPDAEIVSMIDEENSLDLVVSNLNLVTEEILHEWHRLLRPEGLLMFASLGPNTLSEIEQHAFPQFIDMHNLGDALLQTGFLDPIVDMEHFEVKYQDNAQVLSDLNMMGILTADEAVLSLTYEIVYGHAWNAETKDDFKADSDGMVKIPLAALRARLRQQDNEI